MSLWLKFSLPCLFLMVGCERSDVHLAPGSYVNTSRKALISELAPEDVVVIVNGEPQTKRDFTALLTLKDRIWRIRQGRSASERIEDYGDYEREAGYQILMELAHHATFRQYAAKKGIVPSEAQIAQAATNLLQSVKRPTASVEAVANEIGGDAGAFFRKIPYIDAQDALLRQTVTTNDLTSVSEAEIQDRIEFVKQFDANADRLNGLARSRLEAVRKRILAGESIVEIAKSIEGTVHPEYAEKWGTFQIQEFPADEDLHKWLLTAKVGDLSGPLDLDDGLAIVKLLAKGKGDAPPGCERPDNFTLIRCTVQAFERMRVQNRQEMTEQLLRWKLEDAQRKLGLMLFRAAVFEYPNGTNLFDQVEVEKETEK